MELPAYFLAVVTGESGDSGTVVETGEGDAAVAISHGGLLLLLLLLLLVVLVLVGACRTVQAPCGLGE